MTLTSSIVIIPLELLAFKLIILYSLEITTLLK